MSRGVCLVSCEAPFAGGGIGVYVGALARLLAGAHEVTVVTTDRHRDAWERGGGAAAWPGVRWVFAAEPSARDTATYAGYAHAWSASAWQAVREAYAGGPGPALLEFPDHGGEAFVALQARRGGDPLLAATRIVVRLHTSTELCKLLDGHLGEDRDTRCVTALERYTLRHADLLLYAGGDILGAYGRYYGPAALAEGRRVRHPASVGPAPPVPAGRPDGPVRFLHLGRLERRKGVLDLLRALTRDGGDGWALTFAGADTDTGPLGTSMQAQLELAALGDPRVRFTGPVPRDGLAALFADHDVVCIPSRWECWPYVALEAMAHGRPLLATPTGGLVELVRDGVTGRLAADSGPAALAAAARAFRADPAGLDPAACIAQGRALTDPGGILADYGELVQAPDPRPAPRPGPAPLVSVVIPYHRLADHLEEAAASAAAQTHPAIELIVVDDGSADPADAAVLARVRERHGARVVTQSGHGLSHARNTGIALARGDYVLPLDADNALEPGFVARCLAVLQAEPGLGYVTTWSAFIDEAGAPLDPGYPDGYMPLGNFDPLADRVNVCGDAVALLPRAVFDRVQYSVERPIAEDWLLYRELREHGLEGHVIPERLVRYRVREGSMYRRGLGHMERVREEMDTELALRRTDWTAAPA